MSKLINILNKKGDVLVSVEARHLDNYVFQGLDLEDACLQNMDFWDTNLEDANLRNANLQNANLQGACLRYVSLEGANLNGANLEGANLNGANLKGASLDNTTIVNADFTCADLRGTGLTKGILCMEAASYDKDTKFDSVESQSQETCPQCGQEMPDEEALRASALEKLTPAERAALGF